MRQSTLLGAKRRLSDARSMRHRIDHRGAEEPINIILCFRRTNGRRGKRKRQSGEDEIQGESRRSPSFAYSLHKDFKYATCARRDCEQTASASLRILKPWGNRSCLYFYSMKYFDVKFTNHCPRRSFLVCELIHNYWAKAAVISSVRCDLR